MSLPKHIEDELRKFGKLHGNSEIELHQLWEHLVNLAKVEEAENQRQLEIEYQKNKAA